MKGLTPIQRLFVHEYLVDLNATQAAIRAGYSEDTARQIGSENLSKPYIKQAIQEQMDARASKIEITAEKVLESIYRIANVDIGDAYDDAGYLLPIKEMPESIRKSISSIKVFEEFEGKGEARLKVGEVREVKFWDKTKSLELLGRHLRLFIDKVEHSSDKENPLKINLTKEDMLELLKIARGGT